MKKINLIVLFLFCYQIGISQLADAFKYQAVVRDVSGNVIKNANVSFRVSILSGSAWGDEVYIEKHLTQTNQYGMVNLEIGAGVPEFGDFTEIDWGADKHFLKLEFDETGNENFHLLGISQLLSVPYAMHAMTVTHDEVNDADHDPTNELQSLVYEDNQLSLSDGNTVELNTSPWQQNDSSIYYNEGNVGIGISDPQCRLDIEGIEDYINGRTFIKLYNHSVSTHSVVNIRLRAGQNDSFTSLSHMSETYTASPNQADFGQLWTTGAGLLLRAHGGIIRLETSVDGATIERMRIDKEGNVGIGTSEPNAKMEVSGGDVYINEIGKGIILRSPNGQCWRLTPDNNGAPQFSLVDCPN